MRKIKDSVGEMADVTRTPPAEAAMDARAIQVYRRMLGLREREPLPSRLVARHIAARDLLERAGGPPFSVGELAILAVMSEVTGKDER